MMRGQSARAALFVGIMAVAENGIIEVAIVEIIAKL